MKLNDSSLFCEQRYLDGDRVDAGPAARSRSTPVPQEAMAPPVKRVFTRRFRQHEEKRVLEHTLPPCTPPP